MHLYILGRQPKLGLAELERVCGAESVTSFGDFAALVEDPQPEFSRLGGSVKQVEVIGEIPFKTSGKLNSFFIKNAAELFELGENGRHTLGISLYGISMPIKKLNALMLTIKKQLRTEERSIRIIEHKTETALESASVIHNGLLEENGRELVVAVNGSRVIFGLTKYEQDIESYTIRDRERPARDAKVGMLPPKLAQIIVNVSAGDNQPANNFRILDPFCGTGVALQEAALMGFSVYGSDIEERIVRFARENINWLQTTRQREFNWYLERADATNHNWQQPISAVAAETYLGPPLTSLPDAEKLTAIVQDCDDLHRKFLQNIAPQLSSGTWLCLAIPAWREKNDFHHLPMLDDLEKLGYNRVDFKHVRHEDLIYYREDQIVARQLLVITRK